MLHLLVSGIFLDISVHYSSQAISSSLIEAEASGKDGPFTTPRSDLLESWALYEGHSELAPVASVVGGIVANHVIRAVSGVGAPIKNLFLFSLFDNNGMVEDMPLMV